MDVLEARSALGLAARKGDQVGIAAARRALAAAKIRREIQRALEGEYPITSEQRVELINLLRGEAA